MREATTHEIATERLHSQPGTMEIISQVHTAYRKSEELKATREAFINFIKRKRRAGQSPEQIENMLQKFLSTAFPDKTYYIKLNWKKEEENIEKTELNTRNPFFLTENRPLSTEEIAGHNIQEEGWSMWSHYSYEQWYEWYIHKPSSIPIGNPIVLTLLPLVLPLIYYIPRAVIAMTNNITNKYNDDNSSLVKLENLLETPLSKMPSTETELHFMRTFLIKDYHEKTVSKFSNSLSKGLAEDLSDRCESKAAQIPFQMQNHPPASSPQKIAALMNNDTNTPEDKESQNHLQKFKISGKGMAIMMLTAFLAGFFAWPVSLFANVKIAGTIGLTTAAVLTGAVVVIGVVTGAIYAYNSYKESKKTNKKINALEKTYLGQRQEKIIQKTENLNAEFKNLQAQLEGANKDPSIIEYNKKINEKNKFIQNRKMLRQDREEVKQLESDISALKEHQKLLEEKIQKIEKKTRAIIAEKQSKLNLVPEVSTQKEHSELEKLNLAIKKQEAKIALLPSLRKEIEATQNLIDRKIIRQTELSAQLNGKSINTVEEENSFYYRFRDFISERDYLSFFTVFLKKDDEFLKISEALKTFEKEKNVRSYNVNKNEKTKVLTEIEKQTEKSKVLQDRYRNYNNINQKLAQKKKLRKDLKELNLEYKNTVEKYIHQAPSEKRSELRKELLSEKMINPKLHGLEYLLQYKQVEKPLSVTVPALVDVKRSIWGPKKESTPRSVKEAFNNLGSAILEDTFSVGEKLYNYFSAASIPTSIVNIVVLGIVIGGAVASPYLLIAGAALGAVFIGHHLYDDYKKGKDAIRDTFLDDPEFAEYTIDKHIDTLEQIIEYSKLRNEKIEYSLDAGLNGKNDKWSKEPRSTTESLLSARDVIFAQKGNIPQPVPQATPVASSSPRPACAA